jgi:hypothetical protein
VVDFSDHADRLSAEADNRLGDLIQYAIGTGGDFVDMRGRIFANEETITPRSFNRMDEVQSGWRLRIAAALVPNPSKDDRLKCARIFGEDVAYRPVPAVPIRDGRYWLVDLQKV